MKHFYTPIFFCLPLSFINSQVYVESSLKEALSNSALSMQSFDNYFSNPAALADLTKTYFQTSIKNFFELESLFSKSLAVGVPIKNQRSFTAAFYNRSGTSFFTLQNIGIGMGKRLTSEITIGANLFLNHRIVEGNSSSVKMGGTFGFLFSPIDNLNFASTFRFLSGSKELSFGMDYLLIDSLILYLQLTKALKRKMEIKYGLAYSILKQFKIAFGMIPLQSTLSFGMDYRLQNKFSFGIALQKNFYLGYSPTASVKITW